MRPMVVAGGVAALSMDSIATELKAAKGTVYNHFRNKEEIVLALAIQAAQQRLDLFNCAALIRGTPRQRVAAIGIASEFFVDEFPEMSRIEQLVRHDLVWEKTSTSRQELLKNCESRCMHAVAGVVRDAVASGDLVCGKGHFVEDIVFGLWSLVYGGLVIESTSPSLSDVGIRDPRAAIRRNCNAMMDGFGWQPLFEPTVYKSWVAQARIELAAFVARQKSEGTSE